MSVLGEYRNIDDFGSYWYDDAENKTNGEFDCVIKHDTDKYDFYECKFYKDPMKYEECLHEQEQLQNIQGISINQIGFVCSGGFDFNDDSYHLIDGDMLYA